MVNTLTIKNIALIDNAQIYFTKGFNVLSGETGAGKSVIIDSLNFVLGAKADKTLIRSGATECFVSAEFNVENNISIQNLFTELDYEKEDLLIISRKLSLDGKNSIKINGNTATVSILKKFTNLLVDVHGQSEHFLLLSTSNQLKLLDKICDSEINTIKNETLNLFNEYKDIIAQLDKLGGDEYQRNIKLDILNYQINEIETVNLLEGEEENLLKIKEKLSNQEKIVNSLNSVKQSLTEEGAILDVLGNALRIISTLSTYGETYNNIYQRFNSIFTEAQDLADTISTELDSFDFSDYNLDEIQTRLEAIKKLKKKYGNDYNEIFVFLENAKKERDILENFNDVAKKLLEAKQDYQNKLYKNYLKMSEIRKKFAIVFSKNVLHQLQQLGMNKSSFSIEFKNLPPLSECKFDSANGIDDIEFYFSANAGEPLKQLSSVISGGEISRFMLAVKTQTTSSNEISTFVFDEIDAGISGMVAKTVAEKLYSISLDTQVIAITHLPQISVFADNNLLIEKHEKDGKTLTTVKQLSKDEKLLEIIRLTGGTAGNIHSEQHAFDLIKNANEVKEKLRK